MSTINSRIRQIRKCKSGNQTEFAQKLGIAQSTMSIIEKDGATVTEQNIKTICSMFNVSESWLRYGTGSMSCHSSTTSQELTKIVDKIMSESPEDTLKKTILLLAAQIIDDDNCYSIIVKQLQSLQNIKKDLEQ